MVLDPQGAARPVRAPLVLAAAALVFGLLTVVPFAWPGAPATASMVPPDGGEGTTPAPTLAAAAVAVESAVERTPAEAAPLDPLAALTFEQRIDLLAAAGARTAELAQADEFSEARRSDEQARAQFAALMAAFPDAGERAIAMASATAADPATDPSTERAARRMVLQLVVAAECARRHAMAESVHDFSRSEPLVQALLDVMPQDRSLAELGSAVLADRPFLRAAHETTVLALVQRASEGAFERRTATRLLLTLWANLQRTGERTSDELSRLALLLLADADPGKRTAACRQLLGDARYRPLVLAWLREHGDRAVATEIAGMAASDLPPADALAVLRELAPVLQRAPNAFLVLGARAPELLADAYRELLATDTQPAFRSDLVAGVGFVPSAEGREIAELALRDDPAPDVRIQAAFALTAIGNPGAGERAIALLLDEPRIAGDPHRLGALVLAMQNLEAAGDVNALDRLGQRLRTMPLSPAGREQLEAMLARALPGGRVSANEAPTPPGAQPR